MSIDWWLDFSFPGFWGLYIRCVVPFLLSVGLDVGRLYYGCSNTVVTVF